MASNAASNLASGLSTTSSSSTVSVTAIVCCGWLLCSVETLGRPSGVSVRTAGEFSVGASALTVKLGKSMTKVFEVRAPSDENTSVASPAGENNDWADAAPSEALASLALSSVIVARPDPVPPLSSRMVGVITHNAIPAAMAVAPIAMRCALRMRRAISLVVPALRASRFCSMRFQSPDTSGSKPWKLFFN